MIPRSKPPALKRPHHKVRTGCRTCKGRRVKCDERFPICQRCETLGCVCGGYGIWGGGGTATLENTNQTNLTIKILKQPNASTVLRKPPVPNLGPTLSAEQQAYLEWFINGTATKAPRILYSPFWNSVNVQIAMQEPMVLQALLALSCAHKRNVLEPSNSMENSVLPDPQEVFLLKQYSGAIKALQSLLSKEKKPTQSELLMAFTTCSLFVLMEYARGRHEVGYVHLMNGIELAKQLLQGPSAKGKEFCVAHVYVRLHNQTKVFKQPPQGADSSYQPLLAAVVRRYGSGFMRL